MTMVAGGFVNGGRRRTAVPGQEMSAHGQWRPACTGLWIDNNDELEVIGIMIGAD